MDIYWNPGPPLTELHFGLQLPVQRNLNSSSTAMAVNKKLPKESTTVKISCIFKTFPQIKGDCPILKARRTRAGCRMSSKIRPILVIAWVNYNNLLLLRQLKLCKPSYVCKSSSFSFSEMNARSVRNKALEIKEIVVDNSVDILSITET